MALFLLYYFWALRNVRLKHMKAVKDEAFRSGQQESELQSEVHAGEGLLQTVLHKVQKLDNEGYDPMSVI